MGKFIKSGIHQSERASYFCYTYNFVSKSRDLIYTTASVGYTFSLSPCGETNFSRLWRKDLACVVDMTSQPVLGDTQERGSRDNNEFFKVK